MLAFGPNQTPTPLKGLEGLYCLGDILARPDIAETTVPHLLDPMITQANAEVALKRFEEQLGVAAAGAERLTFGKALSYSRYLLTYKTIQSGRQVFEPHVAPEGAYNGALGWIVGYTLGLEPEEAEGLEPPPDGTSWTEGLYIHTKPNIPANPEEIKTGTGTVIPVHVSRFFYPFAWNLS